MDLAPSLKSMVYMFLDVIQRKITLQGKETIIIRLYLFTYIVICFIYVAIKKQTN